MIEFPRWVKVTPCKTMTRSYWNTQLNKRTEVIHDIESLTMVRAKNLGTVHMVPTWVANTYGKDEFIEIVIEKCGDGCVVR